MTDLIFNRRTKAYEPRTARSHRAGKGAAIEWIRAHVGHQGDDCLIWPFSRRNNGYGQYGLNGKGGLYPHREMCRLAHGEPPTPNHEAAHSCGKGHDGCVHPQHLSWKTASENHLDRRRHGTAATNLWGNKGKLTAAQKEQMRALKGTMTQVEIGAMFGVPFQTVSRIQRGTKW